jgi:hypothetical protein
MTADQPTAATGSAATPAPGDPNGASERSSLLRISLGRGVLAVAWAAAFAATHRMLGPAAVTLLVAYPLIDAVSSAIDLRALGAGPERRITLFNALLSTLAALGLGLAGASGTMAVLQVFGAWAVVSGAAQATVGLRRRGPELGAQWPMLIAGGLSFLVGVYYNVQAFGAHPTLDPIVTYATAGGLFFLAQGALLALRTRRLRHRAA